MKIKKSENKSVRRENIFMSLKKKRLLFLGAFVLWFMLVSSIFFMLALSTGIGPRDPGQPLPTHSRQTASKIGYAVLDVIWFPVHKTHSTFFRGRSLPGHDSLWLLACATLYGIVVRGIYEGLIKRKK